jgi:ribosome-associated protein
MEHEAVTITQAQNKVKATAGRREVKRVSMSDSLCKTCNHMREVVSGTGSRFLFCQLSQTNSRFPKYPPQPIVECLGFWPQSEAGSTVTGDELIPKPNTLCLDQFLKLNSIAETGGQAKVMIQSGQVRVNGEVETRRRRKLVADDVIEVGGDKWPVKDSVSFK